MITTLLNTKIGEVENKILDVSPLVNKTDYNAKISDVEKKYVTISGYNKFKKDKRKKIVDKSNISNLIKMLI